MESFPAGPEPEYRPEARQKPPSVKTAVTLIWVSVGLGVVSSLISLLFLDDIVDQTLEADASGMSRDTAQAFAIGGVVFSLIISVALAALFAYFIGKGANWARIVYTVLAVIGIIFGLFGLLGSQPVVLLLLSVVSLAISVATLVFLYRPDANAYFKGA